MMEYLKRLFVTVFVAFAAVSCAKEIDVDAPQPEQIRIRATLADQLETRVAFTPEEDENGRPMLSLAWAEGDRIRVYNHEDHTVYQDYTLDPECVGRKQGTFSITDASTWSTSPRPACPAAVSRPWITPPTRA